MVVGVSHDDAPVAVDGNAVASVVKLYVAWTFALLMVRM